MTSPRRPTPTNTDTDTGTGTGTNDTDIGRQVPMVYVCYLDLALMMGETRKEEGGWNRDFSSFHMSFNLSRRMMIREEKPTRGGAMPEYSKGRKWRGWCSSALTQTVRGAPLLVWKSGKADGNGALPSCDSCRCGG